MYCLNRIGRVNNPADFLRVAEVDRQIVPLFPPRLNHDGVFIAPGFLQFIQSRFSRLLVQRLVYKLKISQERPVVLRADIAQRVAYLVDNAELDLGFGEYCLYRFWEPRQAINIIQPCTKSVRLTAKKPPNIVYITTTAAVR